MKTFSFLMILAALAAPAYLTAGETEASQTEPAQAETAQAEATQTEPTQAEPVQTKPVQTKPVQTKQAKAGDKASSPPQQTKALQTAQTPAPAAKKKIRSIRYIFRNGIRYVLLYDVADYYQLASYFMKTGVVLYSKDRRIEMFYDKREGKINGVRTYFLSPLLYVNKRPYISEADFLKVIDPAFRKQMVKRHKLQTIMIDPGHGGKDQGAPGPVLSEKQINLLIAKKLQFSLEKLGFKVIMTRTGDTFPELADRAALCAKHKPDLYISIHCNSAAKGDVQGIETYLLTPPGCASTTDKEKKDTVYDANTWDPNNYRLAYEVQRALLKFTRAPDRGVRHARFYVLRKSTAPAILIECGFLSHRKEGTALATNNQQNKIVAGILSGIARYAQTLRQKQPADTERKKK